MEMYDENAWSLHHTIVKEEPKVAAKEEGGQDVQDSEKSEDE